MRQIPENLDVLNFHSYYLWSIYNTVEEQSPDCFDNVLTLEEVMAARPFRRDEIFERDWYGRILRYSGLKREMLPTLVERLKNNLAENYGKYYEKAMTFLETLGKFREKFPTVPVVCGEGVTYIPSKELLFEEQSEKFFELVEAVIRKYRENGMWGTVIRTCLGPEDPSWTMLAERIRKINCDFLNGSN
jgi:hypothetical protein